ncbi:MAG: hypothetical protein E7449_01755 [Ruminococcaceae bacterium]|nr:hypothetical protein [Oscillospiraceae bacterium]
MSNQASRGRRRKRKNKLLPAIIAVAVVVALAVGLYIYVAPAMNQNTIYPNVIVAGVNVGGMSKMQAEEAVREAVESSYATNALSVQLPDRLVEFPPEVTKVTLNISSAIDEAWRYGRSGSLLSQASALRKAEEEEHKIDITADMQLDAAAVRAQIEKLAAELKTEPVQTKLDLRVEENLLAITVGTSGRSLDVTALYEKVYQAYLDGNLEPIEFDYNMTAPDYVDLQAIYDKIGKSAADAYLDPETGEIVPELNGYGFDLAAAQQRLVLAKEGEQFDVELKTIVPEVTEAHLREIYFRDVLASYDSPYVWNPNRTDNLRLASAEIDGVVIMPGEVFSFNKIVGERTPEKGYKEATVYVNGASVGETGGGVCQVASAIYYTTLLANLEIVERTEHMYFVTYVPAGCDATIYWGQLDYQFRNSTEYPIRVDVKLEDNCVKVKLVGTKTDDTYVKVTAEKLSTTDWKVVDEDGNELVKAPDYGEDVYQNKEDGLYYRSVEKVEDAYTGYYYITYRNVYNADGSLVSTEKEDTSYYYKRDQKHKVELMDPQPDQEPEVDPDWDLPWADPNADPNNPTGDPNNPTGDPNQDETQDPNYGGVSIGGSTWPMG